ncbi:DUF2971 domain-containing protein [Xanthomonas sp. 1678]|uniref:DUF2971 domain-containing protein n=1 Tax=Xanthomonas sp. 1678 TaxID=3158788 RepID=UPI002858C124|nr:hypothetical protein [Xanthomonas translucens]
MDTPDLLYKYKSFNNYLLQELCGSESYFASPSIFNDPLDSKPSIRDDIEISHKEQLLKVLCKEYRPKKDPDAVLGNFRYLASENPLEAQLQYDMFVTTDIWRMLLQEIGRRGVLSLAERWDCPLMWSHYAQQHQGLCLEFSTQDSVARNLMRVRYGTDRAIPLSDLYSWKVDRAAGARERVLDLAFLSKAKSWEYEREWRILAEKPGSLSVPLRLKGIYFGERCSRAIQTVVVKTLHDAHPTAKFYRVSFDSHAFDLHRHEVDVDEEIQCGICPPVALSFAKMLDPVLPSGAIPLPSPETEPDEGPPHFQR